MPRPRDRRPAPRLAPRLVRASAKAIALFCLVTAGVVAAGTPDARPDSADRSLVGQDCSFRGSAATGEPGTALIRTETGRVRRVPFEIGWDVYTGRRSGTLIAVCLDS